MSIQFPSVKPTARSCKMGEFPTKTYRALSGATVKRSFGNKAFSYQLDLQFANIDDATSALILQHYNATKAGFERFSLPASVFAGMSATLQSLVQASNDIEWEYAEPPSLESVFIGYSTITVRLTGEMK